MEIDFEKLIVFIFVYGAKKVVVFRLRTFWKTAKMLSNFNDDGPRFLKLYL